jgi:glutaredoxin
VSDRVVVLTRAGCHLCDDARAVVDSVCTARSITYVIKDVDADPELHRRYSDLVPVVLVDGVEHARYRVDAASLDRALG